MGVSKYEIMLVVDGDLSEIDARLCITNLLSMFENLPSYKEEISFSETLAYPIRKKIKCHRFVINFELENPSVLCEFNRLALLNKNLLRHLVINETKDRSWRARNNLKKIKDFEIRQEKFKQYLEFRKNSQTHAS